MRNLLVIVVMVLASASLYGWSDVDVQLEIEGIDAGVNWTRHNEHCVHQENIYCKSNGGDRKDFPCKDGDEIHVDFDKTGDGCSGDANRHLNFRFTVSDTGQDICEIELHRRNDGSGFDFETVSQSEGFTCSGRTENNQPLFRISAN